MNNLVNDYAFKKTQCSFSKTTYIYIGNDVLEGCNLLLIAILFSVYF